MSTEPKWPPGPWRTQLGDSVVHIVDGAGRPIADTATKAYYERHDDRDRAIAHLLAAAPDLYAVLAELMRIRDWSIQAGADKAPLPRDIIQKFAEMQVPAVKAARAALAKAEGRTE